MKRLLVVILLFTLVSGLFASNWKRVYREDCAAYEFVYYDKETNCYMTSLKTKEGYDLILRYMNEKEVANNPKSNVYWSPRDKKEIEKIKETILNTENVSWENVVKLREESN